MKMLALSIVLMSLSWSSQASNWRYADHDQYEGNAYFWDKVERRQHRQHERVERGVEQGLLTRYEIKKLKREQKRVAKQIRRTKRHRYLRPSCKQDILAHLDYVSQKIYDFKHNRHYARRTFRQRHDYVDNNYRGTTYNGWNLRGRNEDYATSIYFRF